MRIWRYYGMRLLLVHCGNEISFCFLCASFKNGSLTRERIRNNSTEGSWNIFNQLLESTPRGNFGNMGKYKRQ